MAYANQSVTIKHGFLGCPNGERAEIKNNNQGYIKMLLGRDCELEKIWSFSRDIFEKVWTWWIVDRSSVFLFVNDFDAG